MAKSFVRSFLSFERARPRFLSIARAVGVLALMVVLVLESPVRSVAGPMVQSPEGWGNGGAVELVPPTATIPAPCVPVDCKGNARPRAYDINRDCAVSTVDSDAITKFLNSRSPSSRVMAQSEYLDANGDGWVDPRDVLTIIDALNESECIAQPPTQNPQPTNTPTPLPTATSTATITATPTRTATATATETPAGASPCQYYTLTRPAGAPRTYADEFKRWYDMSTDATFHLFDGAGRNLTCLDTMVQKAKETCDKKKSEESWLPGATCIMSKDSEGFFMNKRFSFVDDFGAGGLMDTFFKNFTGTYQKLEQGCLFYRRFASGWSLAPSGRYIWAEQCIVEFEKDTTPIYEFTGTLINKDCKIVKDPVPASSICGSLVVDMLVSPISLDWDGNVAVDKRSSTIVDFKLRPDGSHGTYLWRASEDFPLLAIDLNRDGAINDGSELFGEWTFGGKTKVLAASLAPERVEAGEAWRDGFEALASLDRTKDGRLTGEELKEIVLFFDRNRNGISEAGEVVPASEAGLRMLSVSSDYKDATSGDVVALHGFERIDKGDVKSGKAVDWYAKAYASKGDALDSLALTLVQPAAAEDNRKVAEATTSGGSQSSAGPLGAPDDKELSSFDEQLSGMWKWHIDGKASTGGIFIFASTNGIAPGASLVEIPIKRSSLSTDGVTGAVTMSRFIGSIAEERGKRGIRFEIQHDAQRAMSFAVIGSDGVMRGETKQLTSNGDSIEYSWIARRILR